ncbi:Mitogen-activated protein kinase kinase 6 [Diplonema papillatum]|nr:Mitogen-activated protein kinase kinase 6 [Diplonema papillatum]
MKKRAPQNLAQLNSVESSYPSYDVSQSGSFSFRNLKLSKEAIETETDRMEHSIDIESIDLVNANPIGGGSSGRVVEAVHIPSGKLVAVKSIPVSEKRGRDEIQKELTLMLNQSSHTGNDHIVSVYGAHFDVKGFIMITMERMNGSLADAVALECNAFITEPELQAVSKQIVLGMEYLHTVRKVVHRDVKPANLLLNSDGLVKISDFGVSKATEDGEENVQSFVGTQFFMSPERLQAKPYSYAADVWSLGVSLAHCAHKGNPWLSLGVSKGFPFFELLNLQEQGRVPSLPDYYSPAARAFVAGCLQSDPAARPSASDLLAHPWLNAVTDESSIENVRAWVAELIKRVWGDQASPSKGFHTSQLLTNEEELNELDSVISGGF